MSTCRNQLMNEGKLYGKSSCAICGSILFGGTCKMNVQPNPPAGSNLESKHYVPVGPSEPVVENKYAVIYTDTIYHEGDERSRTNPGHGYPAYTESIQKIECFQNEEALKTWIERNTNGYSRKTFTAIRYQELKVKSEVKVTLA